MNVAGGVHGQAVDVLAILAGGPDVSEVREDDLAVVIIRVTNQFRLTGAGRALQAGQEQQPDRDGSRHGCHSSVSVRAEGRKSTGGEGQRVRLADGTRGVPATMEIKGRRKSTDATAWDTPSELGDNHGRHGSLNHRKTGSRRLTRGLGFIVPERLAVLKQAVREFRIAATTLDRIGVDAKCAVRALARPWRFKLTPIQRVGLARARPVLGKRRARNVADLSVARNEPSVHEGARRLSR